MGPVTTSNISCLAHKYLLSTYDTPNTILNVRTHPGRNPARFNSLISQKVSWRCTDKHRIQSCAPSTFRAQTAGHSLRLVQFLSSGHGGQALQWVTSCLSLPFGLYHQKQTNKQTSGTTEVAWCCKGKMAWSFVSPEDQGSISSSWPLQFQFHRSSALV